MYRSAAKKWRKSGSTLELHPKLQRSKMDPLSVAASVAGLLQVGAKVIGFLSSVAEAPTIVRHVLVEVRALRIIFRRLQIFIANSGGYHQEHASQVDIDDLVAILTSCVCSFSELDDALDGCDSGDANGPRLNLWDRARWAAKEQGLVQILRVLQSHKASLSLLLSMWVVPVFAQGIVTDRMSAVVWRRKKPETRGKH